MVFCVDFQSLCAMRKYAILLIVAIVLLISCNPDDGQPPLTPDLVTTVNAYDLDNNGNSSDIRVDFKVENNLNVREHRVMILQSKDSSSFILDVASSIPKDNYLVIDPVPFETTYTINRLPSTFPDVNGALIVNGVEYVVAILVEGIGNFQLSEFSKPFTLRVQGIYAGDYEGFWIDDIIDFPFGALCGPGIDQYTVSSTITGSIQNDYRGDLLIIGDPNSFKSGNQGSFSFIIINNIISNFLFNQSILCYGRLVGCPVCAGLIDPCDALFTGQGINNGDLNFEISLTGVDCMGEHVTTISLFRQ